MRSARSVAPLAVALLCALPATLGACGPSVSSRRAERLAEGQAQLEGDPSAALRTARAALLELGEDPQLELLAAKACLALGRRGEALEHAEQGLAGEDDLSDELRGDLAWVKGFTLVGRFRDLGVEDDWRAANTILEQAAAGGSHRPEAAFLLVALQDLGNHRDDERQLKYARLLRQLEPDGQRLADVRASLEQKGLSF